MKKLASALGVGARAARSYGAVGVAGSVALLLCSCTLVDDSFEPELVSASDAGALSIPDVAAPPPADTASSVGCRAEGAEVTTFNASDPRCYDDIGLEPGVLVSAAPDAGALAAPGPSSLAMPPCQGDLGEFGVPQRITGLDFDENVFGPSLSSDGRTLYFSAYVGGTQQIYSATRSARGVAFSDVIELPVINSPGMDGTPFITADGSHLYFFSDRAGGTGRMDIWVSERQGDAFAEPQLTLGINSREADLLPWLSEDGLTLLFVSARSGGRGGSDLWRSTRTSLDATFETPSNVFDLSSGQNEGRAVLSADGRIAYFSSDRPGGRGGPDIWRATRDDARAPFTAFDNLGWLNTNDNEQDVLLSKDETELYFASSRGGGTSELYRAARSCD